MADQTKAEKAFQEKILAANQINEMGKRMKQIEEILKESETKQVTYETSMVKVHELCVKQEV